jgi:pyruvate kinase
MEKKACFIKTKIIATIGPSSESEHTLTELIKSGMSVARLNFSHGSYDQHLEVIRKIREISREEEIPVVILQDLCGPKIRLGVLPEPVTLKKNQSIALSVEKNTDAELYTDFKELADVVKKGEALLIDDGNIELTVTEVNPGAGFIRCKVKVPGVASSKKGINLPDCTVPIPVFTAKDKLDLEFGLSNGVDLVAMSFVDSPSNIIPVKKIMKKYSREIPVIAKIERPAALKIIDEIMDAFDGIMVARGDLGVEVHPEEVPVIQKKLIRLANVKNKYVITATQMLESMINNPRPTRAEASDVFNAILDGTDAVMLSGETAVGKYPVDAVKMMRKIAQSAEECDLFCHTMEIEKEMIDHTEAIAKSASRIAEDVKADFIIVFSSTGNTALKLSKYRPVCPVLGISYQKDVVTRMNSYWGISPHYVEYTKNTDDMLHLAEEMLRSKKLLKQGDIVITVSGNAPMKGATNMLKISKLAE